MRTKAFIKVTSLVLACAAVVAFARFAGKYPASGFFSPVEQDIRLSGTFGELRTNHFHAGLDIKSKQGVTGDQIFTTADGFVSRIKVEEYGYGNALYIQHPSGFTSVYAHLDRFAPEIAEYIKNEQYKAESFEMDLYLPRDKFPVKRGDWIGIMGNTGYSFGPHLHFEIRHTLDQVPINPLHFGFNVADDIAPVIRKLILYEYDEEGFVIRTSVLQPKKIEPGVYEISDPLLSATSMVGFGIQAFDTQTGTSNQNGVYSVVCKVDEMPTFSFALDEIPFEKTRYMNAHIDYTQKIMENDFYHRCHSLEGNKLPIYFSSTDQGKVYINAEQFREVSILVSDFKQNTSKLNFKVKRDYSLVQKARPTIVYQTIAQPDQVNVLSQPGIQVVWPAGSFYERTPLNIDVVPNEGGGTFSPYFDLQPSNSPVHYYFDVLLEGLAVPSRLHDKVFIGRCEPDGSIINCGGQWIGNNLTTGVRQMSTYAILADTIPPKITPLHFNPKMTGWTRMAFKITDNFRIKDRGRDLIYDAWVDDQWILMSLDGKSGILTHLFDGRILPGDHKLRIRVIDDRGNQTVFEKTFTI